MTIEEYIAAHRAAATEEARKAAAMYEGNEALKTLQEYVLNPKVIDGKLRRQAERLQAIAEEHDRRRQAQRDLDERVRIFNEQAEQEGGISP